MAQPVLETDKKGLREFGIVTGAIVAGLFGLLLPWLLDRSYPMWPWYVLLVMTLVGMVAPVALRPVYKVWMRFGLVMGWLNTRLILGLVFYSMFTPVAVILKLLGKDSMRRKPDRQLKTYRVASKSSPREQMEKPF